MNAPHDQNFVKAKMGVLFSDGVTLVPIAINPVGGGFKVNTSDVVSAPVLALFADNRAIRDENYQPCWLGTDSTDSSHVLPIFVDADGAVLIDM